MNHRRTVTVNETFYKFHGFCSRASAGFSLYRSIFCWEHSRVLQVEISGIELATLEISQRSLYIISEVSSKKDNFMQRLEALLY